MTDQYYAQEDNQPDTPETALANWNNQASALANFAPAAAQDLNDTEQALGHAYSELDAALNELPLDSPARERIEAALNEIPAAWEISQRQAQRVVQGDHARQAAETAIEKLNERRKQIQDELSQLVEAAEQTDTSHPLIAQLAESIQEEVEEYFADSMYEDAMGYAFEQTWETIHEELKALTGLTWDKISPFVDLIEGQLDLTEEQKAVLVAFIESLSVVQTAHE